MAVLAALASLLLGAPAAVAGAIRARVAEPVVPYEWVSLRAYRLAPDYQEYSWRLLPGAGSYSFPVPAGMYATVLTTQTAAGKRNRVRVVRIRGALAESPTSGALAALPAVRVSVGSIRHVDSQGAPIVNAAGGSLTGDGILITEMVNAQRPCESSSAVVEDRDVGKFREIMKELELQKSDAFPPEQQALARRAIRTMRSHAPQYRLTGSVPGEPAPGSSTGTAHMNLVHIATGKVVWSRDYTADPATVFDLDGLLAQVSADAWKYLCDPLPQTVAGTFSAVDVVGTSETTTYHWSGDTSFTFLMYMYEDPQRPEVPTKAMYAPDFFNVSSWSFAGSGGGCSWSGSGSHYFPPPVGGYLLIDLITDGDAPYPYDMMAIASEPDAVQETMTCPNSSDTFPVDLAADLMVAGPGGELPGTNLATFSGTNTVGGSTWNWSMTGSGTVTPPAGAAGLAGTRVR